MAELAVDREYLNRTIAHLEQEKSVHNQKFAGNPKHNNCLPRFDTAIQKLKDELKKTTENKSTEN